MHKILGLVVLAFALTACASDATDDGSSSSGGSTTPEANYPEIFKESKSASADATKLDGLWGAEVTAESGGVEAKAEYRLEFRDDHLAITSRCSGDGYETTIVGVTTPASWNDSTVTLTGGPINHDKQIAGPAGKPTLVCKASVTGSGTANYTIANKKLTFIGLTLEKYAD